MTTTTSKGSPMFDEAQVGDIVLLTVIEKGQVTRSFDGRLYINRNEFYTNDRTVEILSRASLTLPSEPGTWWLDNDKFDDVWRVGNDGVLRCVTDTNLRDAKAFAPFRQLVLK